MSIATRTAQEVTGATIATGRSRDRNPASLVFLGALWFSLFFGVMVLLVLIVSTALDGAPRFDADLITRYDSVLFPERTGFRAGILGSLWIMVCTAALAIPLGIAAAVHLEEFADPNKWYNRFIEVNVQNLAAVPAIVYGLLAVAALALVGFTDTGVVIGGAVALALLILPVIIITTRESVRAVPQDIRHGSLALGATILGLSRAIGEAAPLLIIGIYGSVRFDPEGLTTSVTALPIQIFSLSASSKDEYQQAASAAIIVLLVMILGLNALAIFIRNKFQRSW
jgi:ABC-type phosphate transport system permease subunit